MANESSRTQLATPSPSKRQREFSLSEEEAYAGPAMFEVGPLPDRPSPSTPPSATSSLPRAKRSKGSPDEWRPFVKDGVLVEQKRVGGPTLCRLPAKMSPIGSDDHGIVRDWDATSHEIADVVDRHGIHKAGIHVFRRSWRHDGRPEKDWPIVVIVFAVAYDAEEFWHDAACQIRDLLLQKGFTDVSFEIVDPEVTKPTISSPILPSDRIVNAWPTIKDKIINILLPTDARSLHVLRRGKEKYAENPATVTVTIPEGSTGDWVMVREKIVAILDENLLHEVAVEVGVGATWVGADPLNLHSPPLPERAWIPLAEPGVSIGLVESIHSSSTFGGFVEVKFAPGGWKRYGITCHHAIFPEMSVPDFPIDATTIHQYHESDFKPNTPAAKVLHVSQPSLMDQNRAIEYWQARIYKNENEAKYIRIKKQIEMGEFVIPPDLRHFEHTRKEIQGYEHKLRMAHQHFTDGKNVIGSVWATSGLRRTDRVSTLDWALVDVKPERTSSNYVPAPELLPPSCRGIYAPMGDTQTESTFEFEKYEDLFKIGRTTMGTWGKYNEIKAVYLPDWKDQFAPRTHFEDHSVIGWPPMDKPFSEVGDSGAFVFDRFGNIVGLLVGGDDYAGTSRFTALKDLFKDIVKIAGAEEVRLP